jgi:hypothetical protein
MVVADHRCSSWADGIVEFHDVGGHLLSNSRPFGACVGRGLSVGCRRWCLRLLGWWGHDRRRRCPRGGGGLAGEESSDITDRAHQRRREHHRGVLVDTQLDAALNLAEELNTARIEFLRSVIRSAGQTLSKE